MCACACVYELLMFGAIYRMYARFILRFNWSISLPSTSCGLSARDNTYASICCCCFWVSECTRTIVNVNVCQKQHMLLYTLLLLLLLPPLVLLVANTIAFIHCKHKSVIIHYTLQQISDFRIVLSSIKTRNVKEALVAAAAAAANAKKERRREKWVHCFVCCFVFELNFVSHIL